MVETSAKTQQLLPLVEHLARAGRRAIDAAPLPGGLRPRHLVALNLFGHQGPANQQGLAEALSLDPSNVVGLLNELEERGLITRRRDPADRRRHIVELSSKGEGELDRAKSWYGVVADELLNALTTEERATLHELLARVVGGNQVSCAADGPVDKRSSPWGSCATAMIGAPPLICDPQTVCGERLFIAVAILASLLALVLAVSG